MKKSKAATFFNRFNAILILVGLLVFSSCVQSPNGKRKKSGSSDQKTSNGGTPNTPTFSNSLNFFQNGSTQSSSSLTINTDFSDTFYLRGDEVDNLINPSNKSIVQCMVVRFQQSLNNKLLVIALSPQFFFNFSTQTQEYYYLASPSEANTNQTFCNKPGINSALTTDFPGETISYSLIDICPSCVSSLLSSDPVQVRTSGGTQITNIETNYLSIRLTNNSGTVNNGPSCGSSQECQSKGFDCCSLGQCVNDKQLKDGTDTTSAEYLQAEQDIFSNPSNIFNYPNFYHLCSVNVPVVPTPTPPVDPSIEAALKFTRLKELYECTTPVEGEMSLCTLTFEDADINSTYQTGLDDRSFFDIYTGTNPVPEHSIEQIIYAGEILFSNRTFLKDNFTINGISSTSSGAPQGNDTITDAVSIFLDPTYQISNSAPNQTLKVQYRIDGSCKRVSSNLAKCEKHYVQGENLSKVTDHFPASNEFLLPFYADTNKTIKVEVDDTTKLQGSEWVLTLTSPAKVTFQGVGLQVYDTQKIKITYFVDLNSFDVLQKVEEAANEIKTICDCGTGDCTLEEVVVNNAVVDYSCKYPEPDIPAPPLQQTVLLSSKTVPVRYYDADGVYQSDVTFNSKPQEGTAFKYENGNLLKPNNIDNYIGFNEIYGSITSIGTDAKSAKEVPVIKGRNYDIFVDTGTFSSCFFCGTDYFSGVTKLFPANFLNKGGGYSPDLQTTNPIQASTYPAHDKIFGRACFVPATMIPWTHKTSSDRQQQRKSRMAAQHFLFANGYQRDWFGFDYGSVIGSFDGVRWFAIGNQRRIKSESTKLFLAVNSYFGDQTIESTFTVVVSDASSTAQSGSTVTTDFDSDGAQCQQNHLCNTDRDCATQLGWEYVCETVSTIKTKWPRFDSNGLEVPELEPQENLINLLGGLGGATKRCVYRGRGAPCNTDYQINDPSNSYSGTDSEKLHACTSNTYCQQFLQGVQVEKFNNKIARFGKSVKVQNSSSTVLENDLDEFGLGARLIGRPYSYHGDEAITTDAQSALSNNNISAICIPGRNPSDDNVKDGNENIPGPSHLGDQVTGMGMSQTGNISDVYLSSCSIFNSSGDYILFDNALKNNPLSDPAVQILAGSQAISTNSLNVLGSMAQKTFTVDFENTQVTGVNFQQNRCLRAPGAACHTDLECAPSKTITEQLNGLDPDDSNLYTSLNKYEIQFWKERLICGQEVLPTDPSYDLTNNRCCRERGNQFTIGNFYDQSDFGANDPNIPVINNTEIPGIGISLSNSSRYSRTATMFDKLRDTTNPEPQIRAARADQCGTGGATAADCTRFDDPTDDFRNQWKTISTIGQRTCCTGHWIRHFDSDDNGGGHTWGSNKHQDVPKESFKCMNWTTCVAGSTCSNTGDFICDHVEEPDDAACKQRETSNSEATTIFNWLNTLELTGIPQIGVKTEDFTNLFCKVRPDDQTLPGDFVMPNLIKALAGEDAEYRDSLNDRLYSAADPDNFETGIKQVFSDDTFSCCLPTGTQMNPGDDPKLCCTGLIANTQNNGTICALPDFTNVTVYFNRFVSSAAKDVAESQIDADTGYITNPIIVENLACQEQVCASGALARGISLSNLKIPGKESNPKTFRRFIDENSQATNANGLADLYDAGLRWNDDVYCVPNALATSGAPEIKFTICN
ncbi:MAG: hypothetical protein CME70_16320 [Halobacteriovorax sp.]|nr:hypothetical protein [Halobacteriovorax sp.]|tara:strand:+ start:131148 stop:136136 length:4989 start_codon:yes stop_codon:yes gene_type:complete